MNKREIKFRSFAKHFKKWISDGRYNVVGISLDGQLINCYTDSCESPLTYYDNPNIEIMQFTELIDKNGNDIWENDICNIRRHDCVKYDVGEVRITPKNGITFKCYFGKKGESDCYSIRMWEVVEIEVIGNIYENPELLK